MSSKPQIQPGKAKARSRGDLHSAWEVQESDFPFFGESWEQLSFSLNYAILAPSSHNSQPWRFQLGLQEVKLYADRSRALPVVDPLDRELIMSCGAALFHLRLAIRYFGRADEVGIFPDADEKDLLASVAMGSPRLLEGDEVSLFQSITRRRTNRFPFSFRSVPQQTLELLRHAADLEEVRLVVWTDSPSRERIAQFVQQADLIQMSNASFRRELASWMHSERGKTHDGMPGHAYGVHGITDLATSACSLAIRTFDLGNGIGARDRKLVEGSPVLAVLATELDTPEAWLAAGQALARILLLAQSHGLAASYLNQPLEVEGLRSGFRKSMDLPGFPQIILRFGYGPECRPTPRRDIRDILL